ncbi:MAG: homocysteine S-methyltransferase family protein [Sodaliphilus sp.]
MSKVDSNIVAALRERILILDGAMGTLLAQSAIEEHHFATGPFSHWHVPLKGNYDVLNITRPQLVANVHRQYILAGADIITTNTLNSNSISQAACQCHDFATQMAMEGARIAKAVAKECAHRKVWVVGSMGPMNRGITMEKERRYGLFASYVSAFREQAEALIAGGVDMLLLETCYDALNCQAALTAIRQLEAQTHITMPVIVSATVTDSSGRMLSGHDLKSFHESISSHSMLAFGMNCVPALDAFTPLIEGIANAIQHFTIYYPNAGLPSGQGVYPISPKQMARHIRHLASQGCLNIVGGCCGTTPEHISHIAKAIQDCPPHHPH